MPTRAAKVVLTLAVFTAVAVIMLNPIISTVNGHTGTQTVTNETVQADFNENIDLQGYNVVDGSETVWGYNQTSGSYEQATASDYTIHNEPGTISFNNTSLIDSGENVKVTYDYQATGETSALVLGFIPVGVGLFIFYAIASKVQGMM